VSDVNIGFLMKPIKLYLKKPTGPSQKYYDGYYLYNPTQTIYVYGFNFNDGKWEIFNTVTGGYPNFAAAQEAAAFGGPFTQSNAADALATFNSAITAYNNAVVTRGAYSAVNISDPPAATPVLDVLAISIFQPAGTWAGAGGPAVTTMTYIVAGPIKTLIKPYGGPLGPAI
jgi:hypothetical protein